ncbi:MAG: NTP transferase domain-containing protein [Actinomycetota bacterium]|nr:NTP transferase domain-containing protein [Actinomycetota bacterium]
MTCAAPNPRPHSSTSLPPYDAIVLAGARSERLSGLDKAEITVGGARLIDRALEAVAGAGTIVVVGPPRRVVREVVWTTERPPGGGPAAALGAGIGCVSAEIVVLLAVDLPFVGAPLVSRLVGDLARNAGRDGVILCDVSGRDQPLAGAYGRRRLEALLGAGGAPAGMSLKAVLGPLQVKRLTQGEATHDCDTWADVEAAEAMLEAGR